MKSKVHFNGPASLKSHKTCYTVWGVFKSSEHREIFEKFKTFNRLLKEQRSELADFFGMGLQTQTLNVIEEIRKFESIVGKFTGFEPKEIISKTEPDGIEIHNVGENIFGPNSTEQALKVCEAIAELFAALGAENIGGMFVE